MMINSNKLRWLFWLRWKMFTRAFTRKRGASNLVAQIIGIIILSIFVLGAGVGIAFITYLAYKFLPAPANSEILFLVLTGIFLLWLVLPLFESTANEGLDISKLALFPLTRGEIMASLLVSTLLDIPTVGLFLVLAAVVVGWGTSLPMVLMTLLIMLVFYTQLIAASQLVLALLQGVLHSRRFRDLSVILFVLLASSGYICQIAVRTSINLSLYQSLLHATYSQYLQWLPPGMAARAVQQASVGNWGMSLVWLVALAVITFAFLYLWQLVVERGLTSAESGGSAKATQVRRRATRNASTTTNGVATTETSNSLLDRLFPPQVQALVGKDLKYFWRDPDIKAVILQSLLSMAFLIVYLGFSFFSNTGNSGRGLFTLIGGDIVLAAPLLALFSLYSLTYNTLGFERQAITTLLLFPIKPRTILWSKNVATFAIGLSACTLLVLVAAAFTHGWLYVIPALVVSIAGVCINIGLGNFTSTFFPQKMRMARRGFQSRTNMNAQGGCLRAFVSGICFYVMLVLLLPVAAAVLVPLFLHQQWLWSISLPLSLVYGVAFYLIVTMLVAPRIQTKAPEFAEAIGRE
jgi:ABC-2 type transport system permease protein